MAKLKYRHLFGWGETKIVYCAPWFWRYVATMNWQQVAALVIVGLTAAIFLFSKFSRRKAGSGCGAGCGCSASSAAPPRESVVFHARKGERPQIIVKMK
jgi:hypothetical protein